MSKELLEKITKDPKKMFLLGSIVVILLIGGIASSSAAGKKARLKALFKQKSKEMQDQRAMYKNEVPTVEKIQRLKTKDKELNAIYDDVIFKLKAKQKEYSALRPLEFKEELLKFQRDLESRSGFIFPRGIGFIEYLDIKVPKQEELNDLTKELYVMVDILKIFDSFDVEKINIIERLGKEKIFKNSGNKNKLCRVFNVHFETESEFLQVMEVFNELANSDHFIIIDFLDFEKIDKDKIKSSFIVRYIDYL
ncbi:MAG: Amuc_1100 family pilus-like protein [Candidatus Aureabacteria bacterium]|nr:Amuc_1100 family pilus-like protein [Candidatus Auribacterota bacterium]